MFFWKFYKSIDWPIPLTNIKKKSVIYQEYLYEFLEIFCRIYKTIGTFHGYVNNINWLRNYLLILQKKSYSFQKVEKSLCKFCNVVVCMM